MPLSFAITNCGDVITTNLVLTNNVTNCDTSSGVVLNASNIVFDCNGSVIHSNTHNNSGILLGLEADGITIKNCQIINFEDGISDGIKEGEPCPNKDRSNIVVQDTFLNNNTIGLDFLQGACVGVGVTPFFRNLTLTDRKSVV